MEVERLRDRWLDTEWWVADDPLVAHTRPPRPHLEEQVLHHVEFVHEERVCLAHELPERPCWQLFEAEWLEQLVGQR